MISKKNIYSLEKTKKFFKEHPLVMIYQHNNLSVKQRIDLKIQLQSLNNVKTLTAKNSIVERIYQHKQHKQHKDKINGNPLENLLQGPLFLLGCNNIEQVKDIWGVLKTSPSFLFLGSQYDNQIYTHLDIQKSLDINSTIYSSFLDIFYQQLNFQYFHKSFAFNNLLQNNSVYNNLFFLLDDETFYSKFMKIN
jgi:hypothetical protein